MRKFMVLSAVLLSVGLVLSACSSEKSKRSAKLDPFAGVGSPYYKGKGKIPFGGGRYQLGKPYQVAGRWFTPHEQPGYDQTGLSSWYGEAFHRRMTSNGEWFDMATLTAAHPTLPLPSSAKVTNLENGRTVIVRITDRGPFVGTRVLDVSKRTAEVLGYKQQGIGKIRVQYIGPAPLKDSGKHILAMNRELKRGTPLRQMIAAANGNRSQEVQLANAEPQDYQPSRPIAINYYIQVGSFADPDNAERIRQELADVGPVQIAELEGYNGPLYRVRVGPLHDAEEANVALNQVVGFGLPDARVIEARMQQAALQ